MKTTLITILFLVAARADGQYNKLIIQLTDKGTSIFSFSKPSEFLSQRAIQRRTRFNIAIDSLDIPVNIKYVDSIRNAGNVNILSTSKWLNQVLIETNDLTALKKIGLFAFVKTTKGVGNRSAATIKNDKFREPAGTPQMPLSQRVTEANSDTYNYGSNYPQIHIHEGEYLHNKGYHGESMQIAVLDAGFKQYKTITAFDSIRNNGQVLGERDFVAFDNSVNEDDAHGMQCLSIMSANWPGKMVGTAPKASYWLIRTENAATEYPIEEHNWVVGAEFADSTGCDLISTSLGYTTFDDPSFNHTYNELYKNAAMVSQGASIAVKKGMIVSASAGNDGASSWKYISFPADADSVCTVGAVNVSGAIASFSSYGYPGKVKPNIVSVGSGTVMAGANNLPTTGNGTSYSNPNVAGLIACLWQAFKNVSNMKILDAVYKSADKYNSPDNRYGYGLPNFRIAYQLLKHDENVALYGNEWLFATPRPFNSDLSIKFIGRTDGAVTISLVSPTGQTVAIHNFTSEKEEVYNYTFSNLGSLPPGLYSVIYSDGTTTHVITVQKGNIFEKEWLVAVPNPFKNDLTIYIKGQETGEVNLRLIDTRGNVVEIITTQVTQNETATIHFQHVQNVSSGVYFLQYKGQSQKRTIRLFKL
ncbi:MAG: S8 family peptidase [Bacteroidota bacterium]|nr:S8 family peptidase [Bacteroidota bacterium]